MTIRVKGRVMDRIHVDSGPPILPSQLPKDRVVAIDFETPGLRDRSPLMISLAWYENDKKIRSVVYDLQGEDDTLKKELFKWLDKAPYIYAHNMFFELTVLALWGYNWKSLRGRIGDSMLMMYVLNTEQKIGLEHLAPMVGLKKGNYKEASTAGGAEFIAYAREDAIISLAGARFLMPAVQDYGVEGAYNLELNLLFPLVNAWLKGVRIDKKLILKLRDEEEKELQKRAKNLWKLADTPIDINSPKQLRELIFDYWHVTPNERFVSPKTGDLSVGKPALEDIVVRHLGIKKHKPSLFVRELLEYRHHAKLFNTYYSDKFLNFVYPDGRIRCDLKPFGTKTGRFSSSNPNLQNIPNEGKSPMRFAFIPSPGRKFIDADFDQVEFRLFAHFLGDPELIKEINSGKDFHTATSEMFNIPRGVAKTANFLLIYGGGAQKLAFSTGIPVVEAKRLFQIYHERFPGIKQLSGGTTAWAQHTSAVRTISGLRRSMDRALAGERGEIYRVPANTVVQGAAAAYIKLCMVNLYDMFEDSGLSDKVDMVLQIHDELLFDTEDSKKTIAKTSAIIKAGMEDSYSFTTRLTVTPTVGKNWGEAKG